MRDNGLMIKLMEKGSIFTKMALHIQDNGRMINNMVMELKNGWMEPSMRVISNKV